MTAPKTVQDVLEALKVEAPHFQPGEGTFELHSPVDGSLLGQLAEDTKQDVRRKIGEALESFHELRLVPAPERGQCIRRFGEILRENKSDIACLVTWESGKLFLEAMGEVQEMIDICDFAVGLSRQLHGLTIASERSHHRMMEQWHPLGPIGIISAFNFPVAVWSWNTALAVVCGDPVVWKPSPQTPLSAIACHQLLRRAATGAGLSPAISQVVLGGSEVGRALASDPRLPLISATGSTAMGRNVGAEVAKRLGRSLLELGGNNAMIVTESADLPLALRAIVFAAVGTAGQRCTSLRRLIVHKSRIDELIALLSSTYANLKIGDPFQPGTHVGPVVGPQAAESLFQTVRQAQAEGGTLVCGGNRVSRGEGGVYLEPAIVRMPSQTAVMMNECFAPLLFVLPYDTLEEALELQNGVPQGLSSAIFTSDLRQAESFLGPAGSDCGIANVNIGTSGAEIGGAFGGEKDTGGGRESGSDAWKSYMRRSTNTINYGKDLPLSQGIEFDL
jgi:aldehyde dehydrogenase (NAD+)